jgi:hypothetical protein
MTTPIKSVTVLRSTLRKSALPLLAALVLCFTVYTGRTHSVRADNVAAIRFPAQAHDFALVQTGSHAHTIFVTKNYLPDTLVIDGLDRSCGCTSAGCNKWVVPPGQTFNVDAVLSVPAAPAIKSSRITVRAHAGNRPVLAEFNLRAEAQNIVEFPDFGEGYLRLGTWMLHELPAESVITVSRGKLPLDFDELRAECDSPAISTRVEAVTHDSWRIDFKITSSGILGEDGCSVTFRFATHGKVLPEVVVKHALVDVFGPITASPSSLLLTAAPGQRIRKTIAINRRMGGADIDPPQIDSVATDSKNVIAAFKNDARQSLVIFDYTAPEVDGTDRGDIIVSVSDQGIESKIKLTYLSLVSAKQLAESNTKASSHSSPTDN